MNVFNRVVIILLILVAMILVPLALVFPEQAEYVLRYGADVIAANLTWLRSLTPTAQIGARLILAAIGIAFFMLGLVLLVFELVRLRRGTVRLRDGSGALVMNSVAGQLAYAIDLLPGVLRVRPTVRSSGKAVDARLYVETASGVNVPAKSVEIKETARRVLEEELGLQIKREVQVVINPIPQPRARGGKPEAVPVTPSIPEEPAPIAVYEPEPLVDEIEEPEDSEVIEVRREQE